MGRYRGLLSPTSASTYVVCRPGSTARPYQDGVNGSPVCRACARLRPFLAAHQARLNGGMVTAIAAATSPAVIRQGHAPGLTGGYRAPAQPKRSKSAALPAVGADRRGKQLQQKNFRHRTRTCYNDDERREGNTGVPICGPAYATVPARPPHRYVGTRFRR
jgi:hypothetical protein